MDTDERRLSRFLNCKITILSVYTCPLVPRMAGGSAKICVPFKLFFIFVLGNRMERMKHIMSKTNYNFLHDMLKQCLHFDEKCITVNKR